MCTRRIKGVVVVGKPSGHYTCYLSLLQVLSAEDSEAPSSSPLNRAALAELTNEESVDERSPSLERNRNSMTSESSSSSSNDTLKMRGSYVHMSADEQDDALSGHSSRSSVMLLGIYTVNFVFFCSFMVNCIRIGQE